jgi:hypothetical protein
LSEKGRTKEAAWVESREVEATKEARLRMLDAGRGVPSRSLKKIMEEGSLGRMRENRITKIRVEDFDLILPQASGSTKMKIP